MTPGARVAAAVGVLDAWLAGAPVERALTAWARGARYAGVEGSGGGARPSCSTCCAAREAARRGRRRDGARLDAGAGAPSGTAAGGPVHWRRPRARAAKRGGATPPGVASDPWRDVPGWLHPALRADLGPQADAIVAAMPARAPLYLRVNRRKAPLKVEERLANDGITTTKTVHDGALQVVENPRRLRQSAAYQAGLVEIQDLSVQMACAAVDWPRDGRILDFCAGGGGKTLAIAEPSAAALFAHDAAPRRMSDLPTRAARAGIACTILATEDLPRHAPYDAVLCDVPCSGSGTWRRDPEAKWRLTPERLEELGAAAQDRHTGGWAGRTGRAARLHDLFAVAGRERGGDRGDAAGAGLAAATGAALHAARRLGRVLRGRIAASGRARPALNPALTKYRRCFSQRIEAEGAGVGIVGGVA